MGQFFDTATGHKADPSSIPTNAPPHPIGAQRGIDTKHEGQAYDARIARLAAEAADETKSPQSRAIALREHNSLVKGRPYQLACWAELEARRGSR